MKKCVASFSGVPRKVFTIVSDKIIAAEPHMYHDVSVSYHGDIISGSVTFEAWLHDYKQFWAVLSLFNEVYNTSQ